MKKVRYIGAALLLFLASCRDNPCIDENNTLLRFAIYDMDSTRSVRSATKLTVDSFYFKHIEGDYYFQRMTDTQSFAISLPMRDGLVAFALGKMAFDTVYRDTSFTGRFDQSFSGQSGELNIDYSSELFLLSVYQDADTLFAYTIGLDEFDSLITSETYLSLRTDAVSLLSIDSVFSTWGDTLGIGISYLPDQVSEECGFSSRYKINNIDYTTNLLDSIITKNIEVRHDQEDEIVHIQLYY